MEIPGLPNNATGNLKQKKIISLAPVDQATDERAPVPVFVSSVGDLVLVMLWCSVTGIIRWSNVLDVS